MILVVEDRWVAVPSQHRLGQKENRPAVTVKHGLRDWHADSEHPVSPGMRCTVTIYQVTTAQAEALKADAEYVDKIREAQP